MSWIVAIARKEVSCAPAPYVQPPSKAEASYPLAPESRVRLDLPYRSRTWFGLVASVSGFEACCQSLANDSTGQLGPCAVRVMRIAQDFCLPQKVRRVRPEDPTRYVSNPKKCGGTSVVSFFIASCMLSCLSLCLHAFVHHALYEYHNGVPQLQPQSYIRYSLEQQAYHPTPRARHAPALNLFFFITGDHDNCPGGSSG